MNETDFYNYTLKVPSQMEVVTVSNLRKLIELFPRLADKFDDEDVSKIKEYPLNNTRAIGRVLSYLKYLDVLEDCRIVKREDDEEIVKQGFCLTEKGGLLKETAIYDPNKLKEKWKEVVQDSELYKALTCNDEFEKSKYVSRSTVRKLLANSFSSRVKDMKERVDKGEDYLINFLDDAGLFKLDNEYLKSMEAILNSPKKLEKNFESQEYQIAEQAQDLVKLNDNSLNGCLLFIKEHDFELKIKKWSDLTLSFLSKYTESKKLLNKE